MNAEEMERRVAAFWGATSPSTAQVREMAAIAQGAGEHDFADFMLVAAFSGLRVEVELAKVKVEHFDADTDLLFVPAGKASSHDGKPRPRITPVVADGRAAIRRAIARIAEQPGRRYPHDKTVFVRPLKGDQWTGRFKPWTSADANSAYRPLREQVGAPERFHSLRHHYASFLLDHGVSELDAAIALGHFRKDGHPNSMLVRTRYGHASHMKGLQRIAEAFEPRRVAA